MAHGWTLLYLWKILASVVIYTHMTSHVDAQVPVGYGFGPCESQCSPFEEALTNCESVALSDQTFYSCACNVYQGTSGQGNTLTVIHSDVGRYLLILIDCISCIDSLDPSNTDLSGQTFGMYCGNSIPTNDPTVLVSPTGVAASPVAATPTTPAGECGGSAGYVWIRNVDDFDAIVNCITITGDLIVTPDTNLDSIDLPGVLQTVTGSLIFDGQSTASATSISAPGLNSVGSTKSSGTQQISDFYTTDGLIIGYFRSLTKLSFPMLAGIQSNFLIQNDSYLTTFSFPALSTIGGNLDLTGNFDSVGFPALTRIGGGVNVETTSSDFQCPGNIHSSDSGGAFTCEGSVTNPTPGKGLSSTSSQKGSLKSSATILSLGKLWS